MIAEDNGIFNPHGIERIAKNIRERLRDNYDVVMVITGYEGSGKTNLAIELSTLVDHKFDIERNILLDTDFASLKEKIDAVPQYGVCLYDEAVKQLHKNDWSKGIQQSLVKYFTIFRKQNKCHILCMPSFMDLNKSFRERRVYMWIHVVDRGKALFFKSLDKSPFYAWYVEDIEKNLKTAMEMRRIKTSSNADMVKTLSGTVHYKSAILFPQLPKEVEDRYLAHNAIYAAKGLTKDELKDNRKDETRRLRLLVGGICTAIKEDKISEKTSIAALADAFGITRTLMFSYMKEYKKHSGEVLPTKYAPTIPSSITIDGNIARLDKKQNIVYNKIDLKNLTESKDGQQNNSSVTDINSEEEEDGVEDNGTYKEGSV